MGMPLRGTVPARTQQANGPAAFAYHKCVTRVYAPGPDRPGLPGPTSWASSRLAPTVARQEDPVSV